MHRLVLPLVIALVVSAAGSAQTAVPSFSEATEGIVRTYFQANPMAPQSVPPDIAKDIALGKPLPKGVAVRPLPGRLISKLPPFENHEAVVVGHDVILINPETRVVADISRQFYSCR